MVSLFQMKVNYNVIKTFIFIKKLNPRKHLPNNCLTILSKLLFS